MALREAGRFLTLAGWSPDGRWLLFWSASQCSASLAADGWPLAAVPARGGSPVIVIRHMLLYPDFLTWCGRRLIVAAGPDRETHAGSSLVETGPPLWPRARTIRRAGPMSWVSPTCAAARRTLVAAAGPNGAPTRFGLERRSVWLLSVGGKVLRRLTPEPPVGLSDESPRVSPDGRWAMFVRTRVLTVGRSAISRDTLELVPTDGGLRPVPILDFTSDDFSYYDHFGWPYEIDWHAPTPAARR